MPAYDPTVFNITPYFDDYDETKKFLKVLFRPGYAVQARELTQLQTILQNQIERFGNHIFKDGSKVYGAEIATTKIRYQRVQVADTDGNNIPLDQLIGYEITQVGTTTRAKVVHAIDSYSGDDNYKILFITFLSGSSFLEGSNFTSSYPGAVWNGTFASVSSTSTDATSVLGSNGLSGESNIVSVSDGIFYVDGHFVKNDMQRFCPFGLSGDSSTVRNFVDPTTNVGFNLNKTSISDSQDLTLRDPASGSYNYNAPGADRYLINLKLSQESTIAKDFIEVVRYENGLPTKRILKTEYAELEKTLARRTYDESGSYTVTPFGIDVREHINDGTNRGVYSGTSGDEAKVAVGIEPGKAYVHGHEYETQKTHFLDLDKARTTETSRSAEIEGNLGTYISGAWPVSALFNRTFDAATAVQDDYFNSIGLGSKLADVIANGTEVNLHGRLPHYDYNVSDQLIASQFDDFGGPGNIDPNSDVQERRYPLFFESHPNGVPWGGDRHMQQITSSTDGVGDNAASDKSFVDVAPVIGRAKIRAVVADGVETFTIQPKIGATENTSYRIYLYDIEMFKPNHHGNIRDDVRPQAVFSWVGHRIEDVALISVTDIDPGTLNTYAVTTENTNIGVPQDANNSEYPTANSHSDGRVADRNGEYQYNWGYDETTGSPLPHDNRYKALFAGIHPDELNWTLPESREAAGCSWAHHPIDPDGLKGSSTFILPIPEGPLVKSVRTLEYTRSDVLTSNLGLGDTELIFSTIGDTTFMGEGVADDLGNEVLSNVTLRYNYFLVSTQSGYIIDLTEEQYTVSLTDGKKTLRISGIVPSADDNLRVLDDDDVYTLVATVRVRDANDDGVGTYLRRNKTLTNFDYSGIAVDGANDGVQVDDTGHYFILPHADIYRINGLTGGTAGNASGTDVDRRSDFIFDNGQRDDRYDYGRLYIKPDKVANYYDADGSVVTTLNINYDFFEHTGSGQPFTVDSYTAQGFDLVDIPLYTITDTNKVVSLANVLDFRPSRLTRIDGAVEQDAPLVGGGFPRTGVLSSDVIFESHEYYLPRIDKIVLKKTINEEDHAFEIIKGVPSLNPKAPNDREDSLSLYILSVPPYTHNAEDVRVQLINNQRYTMSDIGNLDKRISNIEYYSTLSELESNTEGRNILSYDGSSVAFKKGVVVDNFKNYSFADISDNDFVASIDIEEGELRPSFHFENIDLGLTAGSLGYKQSSDGLITLNYDDDNPISFVSQTSASKTLKINPFNLVDFLGTLTLDPPCDTWFDVDYRPVVKINVRGEHDNWKVANYDDTSVGSEETLDLKALNSKGWGSQWNHWESLWCGIEVNESDIFNTDGKDFIESPSVSNKQFNIQTLRENNTHLISRTAPTIGEAKTRTGVRVRSLPHKLKKQVNNKIVDVSIVPFIRPKTLTINAHGLKPNTTLHAFFDEENVSEHCTPSGGSLGGTITTDSNGSIVNLQFAIPSGTFTTGQKLFRLTDESNNNAEGAVTSAEAVYHATGILPQRAGSNVVSTRPAVIRRQSVSSENIASNVFSRHYTLNTRKNSLWVDPLAQTFTVDSNQYPSGVFLHSVDLYFASKDENLPVTLQIRPVVDGYPHSSTIVPLSEVVKLSSEVNVDEEMPTTKTNFKFSSPIYLEGGDYAFVLSANSDEYELYAATIGENNMGTQNRITSDPYTGSLFHPQNESVSTIDLTTDLMFKINRCEFEASNATVIFKNHNLSGPISARKMECDTFRINTHTINPSEELMDHSVSIQNANSFDVVLNQNISKGAEVPLKTIRKSEADFTLTSTLKYSPTTTAISPVIDSKLMNITCVENSINEFTGTRIINEKLPTVSGLDAARARYITRRVSLPDGMSASDLRVLLDVYKPTGSDIKIFAKYTSYGSNENMDYLPYVEMQTSGDSFVSTSNFDFREVEYRLSSDDYEDVAVSNITSFVIKICLFGEQDVPPVVRDLRVLALD